MSFNPSLHDAWTSGFDPGIRVDGFRPLALDTEDHVGGITDEIGRRLGARASAMNKRAERDCDRLRAGTLRTELRCDLGDCHALRVLGYGLEHCRLNEASRMSVALWRLGDLKWP
jgi:hypothetical protein